MVDLPPLLVSLRLYNIFGFWFEFEMWEIPDIYENVFWSLYWALYEAAL